MILNNHTTDITHNAIFSCHGVSFACQLARSRRPSLPRDAADYRIVLQYPDEQGEPGWEAEVFIALRDGKLWNPAAHLKVARIWAYDTDDLDLVEERFNEWTRSL